MKPEIKKLLILNAPYLLFVYLFDKVGQAVRLAPGADSGKDAFNSQGFSAAFSNALPSVHPLDLLIGIVGAVLSGLPSMSKARTQRNTARAWSTALHVGVHNFKCKGHLHGRTGGYAHD